MNQKAIRKYEIIIQENTISSGDLRELASIDFDAAFETWEYLLCKTVTRDLIENGFNIFMSSSETKTKLLFCDSLNLQRVIYSSPYATVSAPCEFLANLIMSNKLDVAGECITKIRVSGKVDFNTEMLHILETTFAYSRKKNNSVVPVLNSKQKKLLLENIDKVKGPNKALLLQRIKEIN